MTPDVDNRSRNKKIHARTLTQAYTPNNGDPREDTRRTMRRIRTDEISFRVGFVVPARARDGAGTGAATSLQQCNRMEFYRVRDDWIKTRE